MIPIDSELVRLLMRLGYLAAWNGLYKEAIAVFDGVRAVRPESEVPIIAGAVVALLSGHPDVAVKSLKEGALVLNPGSDLARAHLGCALRLQGREEEGMAMLQEIASDSDQPEARAMAANLISLSPDQISPKKNFL
jgi:tetratricopeptide (TPR) repeat protein